MALDEWDPKRGRSGRQWERLKKELYVEGAQCEMPICKQGSRDIVFGLRKRHPLGPSLDHKVPLKQGGHPTARSNIRVAHYGCNSSAGAAVKKDSKQQRRTSRAYPF